MANNLQEKIGKQLALFAIDWVNVSARADTNGAREVMTNHTEAILQAVRDVVPELNWTKKEWEQYSTNVVNQMAYEQGYNQCRLDMLKELEGGE